MDNMIIAKRIQHYRHLAKLSQEQLADLVDASDTYIRKLEAGVRIPSLDMLLKLSAALNTTPNHLLLSASNLGKNVNASILDLLSAYGGGQRPLVRSRTAAVRSE